MGWMAPMMAAAAQDKEQAKLLAALIAQDTENRYEFKLMSGAFRDSARLQAVLDEEARAQWQLVLKLDNQRILLQRPRDARARDVLLGEGVDPYRTTLGASKRSIIVVVIGLLFALGMTVAVALGVFASAGNESVSFGPVFATLILIAIIMIAAILRRRG